MRRIAGFLFCLASTLSAVSGLAQSPAPHPYTSHDWAVSRSASPVAVSPDGGELYAVDSYWEKHTRGKRSDYIVVRDARTLDVKEDIPLPAGRLLIVSKKYNFDVTPDGHYGLTYNLAPSTAVTG